MSILKSLQFTAIDRSGGNPILARRAKLIGRLEEQRALAENPSHLRVFQRWVKRDGGEKELVTRQQRVRPWWRTDLTGRTSISLFYGTKPIEIEKGKPAIVVPSKDELATVIDTLIQAVREGELDELLSQQGRARPFSKAAPSTSGSKTAEEKSRPRGAPVR